MPRFRVLALLLFILFSAAPTFATEGDCIIRGIRGIREKNDGLPHIEGDFTASTEKEAKLRVPSLETLQEMKKLSGQTIELTDADGKVTRYRVRAYLYNQQNDRYYDTETLDLREKGGMLRYREYHLLKPFRILYKARMEAKSASLDDETADQILQRSEAKGSPLPRNAEARQSEVEARIQSTDPSADRAVQFARDYSGTSEPLVPVLYAQEKRIFVGLFPVEGSLKERVKPLLRFTLDDTQFTRSDSTTSARDFESEVEIMRKAEDPSTQKQLKSLIDYLQNRFGLTSSDQSKYLRGMDLTSP